MFEAQVRESALRPLLAELRQRAESIRREELERALARGSSDGAMLDHLTRRLVDRLLEAPSQALRRADLALDPQHARYLRALFGLDGDAGGPD